MDCNAAPIDCCHTPSRRKAPARARKGCRYCGDRKGSAPAGRRGAPRRSASAARRLTRAARSAARPQTLETDWAGSPTRGRRAPAAAAAAAAQPKPSFMSRWGGLLAGLGIGALLASLFGAQLAPFVGGLLALLLVAGIAYLLFRMFAGRRAPPEPKPAQFAGIGANLSRAPMEFASASPVAASQPPDIRSV